jgi:hypothetical protein
MIKHSTKTNKTQTKTTLKAYQKQFRTTNYTSNLTNKLCYNHILILGNRFCNNCTPIFGRRFYFNCTLILKTNRFCCQLFIVINSNMFCCDFHNRFFFLSIAILSTISYVCLFNLESLISNTSSQGLQIENANQHLLLTIMEDEAN